MKKFEITKYWGKAIIIFLLLALTPAAFAAQTKPARVLLQEGLYAEEVEGNLDQAIKIYQQIVESSEQMEQSAAQATYRIGLCYLKKGDTEQAAKQFKELISKYPKQESLINEAQKQLEKISSPSFNQSKTFIIYNLMGPVTNYIDRAIDLDNDKLLSIPDDQVQKEHGDNVTWLFKNGGDVFAQFYTEDCGLIGSYMFLETLPSRAWDELSAEELIDKMKGRQIDPSAKNIMKWNVEGEQPVFAFLTQKGSIGLLQMLSVDEKAKKVELRYKKLNQKQEVSANEVKSNSISPELDRSGMGLLDEDTRNEIEHFEQSFAPYFKHETRYELANDQEKRQIIQAWEREALGSDFNRRVAAIAALGNAKAKEALDTLIKIAEEPMSNNRPKWIAVRALAQIKDMKAVPTLIGLVNHGNTNVRVYTRLALANITGVYFDGDENAWKKWWLEKGQPEYEQALIVKIPVVISSKPENYSQNVSPDTTEISVTFDRKMMDRSWSWVRHNYPFPQGSGQASYDNTKTTCTLSVKMEPGKAYLVMINSDKYTNFISADGTKAQPFALVFSTLDKNGKPTPIPEEMLNFAKQVNSEIKK